MQVKSKTQKLFIVDLPFDLRYNIWTYLDYMIPVQTTLWFFSFGREHNIKEIKKILNQRWNVRKQYLSIPQRILYMRETGQRDFLVKQLIEEKYVELKTCFMWYRYALINNDRQSFKKIFKWIREKMSREADPNTIPCITRMKLRLIEFVIRIDSFVNALTACVLQERKRYYYLMIKKESSLSRSRSLRANLRFITRKESRSSTCRNITLFVPSYVKSPKSPFNRSQMVWFALVCHTNHSPKSAN